MRTKVASCGLGLFVPLFAVLLMVASTPAVAQFPTNVLQDCWTTNININPDRELEGYEYSVNDRVTFIWKHKVLEFCENYVASIFGFECREGKVKPSGVRFEFRDIQYGAIDPNPEVPELLFEFTAGAGSIQPGRYDWVLFVECNDLGGNGIPIGKDEDVDDTCGINTGRPPQNPLGVVIFGPEPNEALDAAPGGSPPGRGPGEEGPNRPWCFEVFG